MTDKNLIVAATHKPLAIIPESFQAVREMAQEIARSGIAPKSYMVDEKRPDQGFSAEKIAIGILQGLEIGFTPMMALQSIAVVNGMPTVYGDGALAKVLDSGLVEEHREFFEEGIPVTREGEARGSKIEVLNPVAVCIFKRKGRDEPIERRFSYEDAAKAELLGKQPYRQYLKRMLQMRARAWAMRDGFADVLKGLHIREEIEDMTPEAAPPPRPERPKKAKNEPPANAVDAEIVHTDAAPVETHDEDPPEGKLDADEFKAGFYSLLDKCETMDAVRELRGINQDDLGSLPLAVFAEIEGRILTKLEALERATKPPSVSLSTTDRQPEGAAAPTAGEAGAVAAASAAAPAAAKPIVTFHGETYYDTLTGAKALARHLIGVISETRQEGAVEAAWDAWKAARDWLGQRDKGSLKAVEDYYTKHLNRLRAPPLMP